MEYSVAGFVSHGRILVIFIDYDDTILPSTWLIAEQAKWITAEGIYLNNREKFQNLETRAKNLLEKALSLGNVQLVTNAESGWVEKTVTAFLPGLLGLISKIPCTSARNAYQSAHPDPRVWKLMAFHRTVTEWVDAKTSHILYSTNPDHFEMLNLISIGDSETEREALHVLGSTMQHVVTKSLKLSENPSIETVIHQLDSLSSSLQIFAKHVGHLDLVLRL